MAESNAFLAYGITVATESLLYAVAAWPKLQGPFAFLDLVQLRRNKGTLRATQFQRDLHSVVERVPSEVWDVVRHKVVDLELREADVAHVQSLLCDECAQDHDADPLLWAEAIANCESSELWEFEGLARPEWREAADRLLREYGLALPTSRPIRPKAGSALFPQSCWADPNSATTISLPPPLGGDADSFAIRAHCGGWDSSDGDAVVDVSFAVPADAKTRFRRLISQMHLQLVVVTDGILANEGAKVLKGKTELRRRKRKFKAIPLEAMRPGWKLVTMAETTR
ncbi:hypothetical protein JCM10450v2_001301 [Rhodotorula kratochvilovae]